jgi:glycerophosphoryl diester phosphodiesterase
MVHTLKKFKALAFVSACILFGSCSNDNSIIFPEWPGGGFLTQTRPVPDDAKKKIEGVYAVDDGSGDFGDTLVLHWNGDYLGVYSGVHAAYLSLQAGGIDSILYLQGYWRYLTGDETGLANMLIARTEGGSYVFGDTTGSHSILIRGRYGNGQDNPTKNLRLRFVRPFSQKALSRTFYNVSHHGSGGSADYLPQSENTVEIAKIIERFGANGIEIDIRPTSDGIPVLYHDNGINWRLVQKGPLVGPIENYTFQQIEASIRLLHNEKIPSLEQFLDAVIYETTLKFIYVDCKPTILGHFPAAIKVVQNAVAKAKAAGRDVQIYLAITTDDLYNDFITQPDYQSVPTICELDLGKLEQLHSQVWSPRWTSGFASSDIDKLHSEGKTAITWTTNLPGIINDIINEGKLDGVLSDYNGLVAYFFYRQ